MANTKVTGDVIANGTILTVHLADDAITAAKLDSTATGITFADLTVDTDTLYVDAANNRVGIGTTSPDYKLEIESTSDADLVSIKSTAIANNTQMRLGISGNDSVISGTGGSTGNLVFKTYGSERMRIDSSGNVGIKNTLASTIDSASALGTLVVGDGSSVEGITIYTGTSNYGGLNFADATSGGGAYAAYIKFDHSNNSFGHYIGNVERMRIDSLGNVGIGTTSPNVFSNQTSLTINGTNNGRLDLKVGNAQKGAVIASANEMILDAGASPMQFYTGSTLHMLINTSGNVGIGTTSPRSKFDVNGLITQEYGNAYQIKQGSTEKYYYSNGASYNAFGTGVLGIGTTGDAIQFATNNFVRATINSSGNVGIGVVPNAVTAGNIRLDVGYVGCGITSRQNAELVLTSNADYVTATTTGRNAIMINLQNDGNFNILNAPSTTAGSALTFTSRFYINTSGNVGIGTTTPGYKLEVAGTAGINSNLNMSTGAEIRSSDGTGIRLRNAANSANEGGFVRSGLWEGDSSRDPSLFAETGLGLRFYTGGSATERMVIGSSGDVLIATNGKFLQGKRNTGSAVIDMIGFGAGTDTLQIKGGTSGAANAISFYDTGGFVGTFYNGNFGIGRTSPASILELGGDTPTLTISDTGNNYNDGDVQAVVHLSGRWYSGESNPGADNYSDARMLLRKNYSDGTGGSSLAFETSAAGSGGLTEAIRIDKSQNVGIGQTNPSHLLHVKKPNSGDAALMLETVTGGDPTIYFNSAAANRNGVIRFQDNGINVGSIIYAHNGDRLGFQAGSASGETMSIINSAVGIGTTSPQSKLDARGALMVGSAAEDGNFSSTTATGMSNAESGMLEITQGWVGSASSGDTIVFRYNATVWKSWGLEWNFMSTNGMSSGFIGGYNNNSTGHSKVTHNNAHGVTVSFSNSSQNNIITFTFTTLGTHPMASFRYYQSGGDGRPYPSKASITMNS